MAEYSRADFDEAVAITEKLVSQVRRAREHPLTDSGPFKGATRDGGSVFLEATEIFTADVESAFERFTTQYLYAESFRTRFLCANTPWGLIPMDTVAFPDVQYFNPQISPYLWRHASYAAELYLNRVFRVRLSRVQPNDALDAMRTAVTEFLAVRLSARRSNISESPGLQFKVSSDTKGLRVHYSPAYFLNLHNVFGAPTTIEQWIQPGRYVFGAIGPQTPLQFDLASQYDIPPQRTAHLYV